MTSPADIIEVDGEFCTCEEYKETTFQKIEVLNDGHSFFFTAFINSIVQAHVRKLVPKEALETADDPRMLYIEKLREIVADKIDDGSLALNWMLEMKTLAQEIRLKNKSVADLQAAGINSKEDFYNITEERELDKIAEQLSIKKMRKSNNLTRWKQQIEQAIGFRVSTVGQCSDSFQYWQLISEIFDVPVHIMEQSKETSATITKKKTYAGKKSRPLSQHLFVLFMHEEESASWEEGSKYTDHYCALKVVDPKPSKVSDLKILDHLLDNMENVCHDNQYEITQEFVNYCFLKWYVGGDFDVYCKKCRILEAQKAAEKVKLIDMFKKNGDPCKKLFDELCHMQASSGTRTQNKLEIKKLLKETTELFFTTLGQDARDAYNQRYTNEGIKAVKDLRICVQFDFFVITLMLSMPDQMRTRFNIKPYPGKKGIIIGLTANGHNLTDNLFRYPVAFTLDTLFDDGNLRDYCQLAFLNRLRSIRDFGLKKDRESNSNVSFQKRLDEGNNILMEEREEARQQERSRAQQIAADLAMFTKINEREASELWENTFFDNKGKKTWASFINLTREMDKPTQYLCKKSQRWPDKTITDIDEKTIVRDPVTLKNGEICPDYQHAPGTTETNIFLAICQFPGEGFSWGDSRQETEHDCLTDAENAMLLNSANDEKQTQIIQAGVQHVDIIELEATGRATFPRRRGRLCQSRSGQRSMFHKIDHDDDDVFFLFLQKQKIGAELHVYLEEGTYHKRLFRGPNTNDMKK
jgi:hypothetical protein